MSRDILPRGAPVRASLAAGLLNAAVLLPLPLVAFLTLAPGGLPFVGPQHLAPAPTASYGDRGPFLVSDVAELARLERCLHRLQANPPPMPSELAPDDAVGTALLNGWERVARTARRHKCTLDYFLGFGF